MLFHESALFDDSNHFADPLIKQTPRFDNMAYFFANSYCDADWKQSLRTANTFINSRLSPVQTVN